MSKKSNQEEVENEVTTAENVSVEENLDATTEQEITDKEKLEDSEDEITLLKRQLQDANDKFLRLYSDFENFRKRTSKEKLELIQSGGSDVIKDMLSTLDDFDRANTSNAEATEIEAVKEGFKLIQNKLFNSLTSKGLKPMATEVGADFDTDKHEAITNIPAPSPELKGKVVDIIEKGYLLNDKVIRYAKVVVGQ